MAFFPWILGIAGWSVGFVLLLIIFFNGRDKISIKYLLFGIIFNIIITIIFDWIIENKPLSADILKYLVWITIIFQFVVDIACISKIKPTTR